MSASLLSTSAIPKFYREDRYDLFRPEFVNISKNSRSEQVNLDNEQSHPIFIIILLFTFLTVEKYP